LTSKIKLLIPVILAQSLTPQTFFGCSGKWSGWLPLRKFPIGIPIGKIPIRISDKIPIGKIPIGIPIGKIPIGILSQILIGIFPIGIPIGRIPIRI
jgi:hypothetical protein